MLFSTAFHLMMLDTVKIKKAFLSHLLADGASEEKLRCCKLIIKNEIENNLHWQHSIKQNRSKIAEKAMIDFKIPMILGKSER